MATQPQEPVYAWFTPYLSGFGLTYGSTTTLTVGAGSCTDSTTTNVINLVSPVTISTAVTGPGGIDTGVLTASTFYAVYAIASSSHPIVDEVNDEDVGYNANNKFPPSALLTAYTSSGVLAAPSMPYQYDMYRYVGSVLTDGSSHILSFVQTKSTMWYDVAIATSVTAGTSTTYAAVSLAGSVPKAGLEVLSLTALTPNAATSVVNLIPYGSTATVGYALVKAQVAAVVAEDIVRLPATSNASVPTIQYKTSSASDSVAISISGYVDQL